MENDIYLAGFIDGEGCISMFKRKRKHYNFEYHVSITIGQKDGDTLDWIKENYGGNIHLVKRDKSYMWLSSYNHAYKVLKKVTPYLKYKKPQAEIAIKFYEEQIISKKERNKSKGLNTEELDKREQYLLELKRLKKVFTKSNYC